MEHGVPSDGPTAILCGEFFAMTENYFSESNEVSVGDEIRIEISLCTPDGPIWKQVGEVISEWWEEDDQRAVVRVVSSLDEDGDNDTSSGDIWTDCLFVSGLCPCCGDEWTAIYAASEATRQRVQAERDAN